VGESVDAPTGKICKERHPVSDLLFVALTIVAFCAVVGVVKGATKL
jgi:hypothetical protein